MLMLTQLLSHVRLFCEKKEYWTVACQAPLSMGFPRQEYWSRLPFPPLGDLPDPEMEPTSPMSPALAGRFFTPELLSGFTSPYILQSFITYWVGGLEKYWLSDTNLFYQLLPPRLLIPSQVSALP